jgi:hypothetical protein
MLNMSSQLSMGSRLRGNDVYRVRVYWPGFVYRA